MAQEKRLTRKQKILLSRIDMGFKINAKDNEEDLRVLFNRKLIGMANGAWVPTKKDA